MQSAYIASKERVFEAVLVSTHIARAWCSPVRDPRPGASREILAIRLLHCCSWRTCDGADDRLTEVMIVLIKIKSGVASIALHSKHMLNTPAGLCGGRRALPASAAPRKKPDKNGG